MPIAVAIAVDETGQADSRSARMMSGNGGGAGVGWPHNPMERWSVRRMGRNVMSYISGLDTHFKHIDAKPDVLETYHDSFLFGKVPVTVRVRTALRAGLIGYLWHLVEFLLALISGVLYVYSTYYPESRTKWVATTQNIASVAFVLDYVLRVYSEPVRLSYILSSKGLVDLLSSLPVIFVLSQQLQQNHGGSIIRLLQFLRIIRIFSLISNLGIVGSSISEQIVLLVVSTFGFVFLDAGILQWVEYNGRKGECPRAGCMTFWDAFYFLIVTISTVGYGDITPHTQIGQFIALSTILVALVVLPIQIGRITSLASRRPYGGAVSGWKVMNSRFLIISGSISYNIIEEFLAEIYNLTHAEDLEAYPLRVVVLAPFSPSFEFKQIMSHYHAKVAFIEGSPVSITDLERVSAANANAFFLLADHEAEDPSLEDAAQIVRALAVHRFCQGKVRIILEVLEPETQASAVWDETRSGGIEVICPAKIHYKMIARNCFVRGLYTFITNAFTSELQLKPFPPSHFMSEYFHSLDNEIYPVILPSTFHNLLFEEVVEFLFTAFNVVLFALDIPTSDERTGKTSRRVLLHPKGHVIQPDDVGLCFCWNLRTAYLISNFDGAKDRADWKKSLGNRKMDKEVELLAAVSRKWRDKGSTAGLTRDGWTGTDSDGTRGLSSRRSSSPDGHRTLKIHLRCAINKVFEAGDQERGVASSGASVSDRSDAETEEWEQAFSRGEMNNLEGRYPEGQELERATEELLAWPPLPQYGRPRPSVLERRTDVIMQSLAQRTLSIVSFKDPHVLLCCHRSWPANLYYFISELRKPGVPNPPVVILHPDLPSPKQWGSVGFFDDVFFLKGSPTYELDLMRGGVLHAAKVVILADPGSPVSLAGSLADHGRLTRKQPAAYTSDVDNIIVSANVERLIKHKLDIVTVEMQNTTGFYYLRPQFPIPRSMVPTQDYRKNRDALVYFTPPYMEGKVVSATMLGFLLRSSFYNRNTVSIVEQLMEGGFVEDADGISSQRQRVLEQIPVPVQYATRCYSDLFLALLCDQGMLALGLYRAAGTLGAPTAYVFTNPPQQTLVNADDLVYVLV